MDDLLSEKEQLEQIRSWWSEYGGYVIGGLGLGIAILVGFNYYQKSKLDAELASSAMYETLTEHVAAGSLEEAEAAANQLVTDYADTSYAAQARLALARMYMDKNRDQDAADALRAVLASDADDEIKLVARARLARILLYQNKPQEVVDLLEDQDSEAFAAIYSELLGDAYQALGRIEDAQAAYQSVLLDPLSNATVDQQLVQWKALDLPASSATEPEAGAATGVEETIEETAGETDGETAGAEGSE